MSFADTPPRSRLQTDNGSVKRKETMNSSVRINARFFNWKVNEGINRSAIHESERKEWAEESFDNFVKKLAVSTVYLILQRTFESRSKTSLSWMMVPLKARIVGKNSNLHTFKPQWTLISHIISHILRPSFPPTYSVFVFLITYFLLINSIQQIQLDSREWCRSLTSKGKQPKLWYRQRVIYSIPAIRRLGRNFLGFKNYQSQLCTNHPTIGPQQNTIL